MNILGPGSDIKLDLAVLPLLTSFGGLVAGRASGRKTVATKHDLRRSLRVSLSVGFARCVPCFFLSLFSAWIMVGGGAVREFCRSDRLTRASMEKRTLNCMIDIDTETYRMLDCTLVHSPMHTFSMRSMVGWRSRPKSMKCQLMPSRWYSSCSSMNIVWLNSCCSFSFV